MNDQMPMAIIIPQTKAV